MMVLAAKTTNAKAGVNRAVLDQIGIMIGRGQPVKTLKMETQETSVVFVVAVEQVTYYHDILNASISRV